MQRPTSQVKSERERRRTDRLVVVCHGDRRTKLAGPAIACRLLRHALKLPVVSQDTSCFLLRCSVFITQRTTPQMILLFLDVVQSSYSARMNFESNSHRLKILISKKSASIRAAKIIFEICFAPLDITSSRSLF